MFPLKMDADRSSEIFIIKYRTTRRHISVTVCIERYARSFSFGTGGDITFL